MRILMVASTDEELNAILNRVGFNDRLISYWFIKTKPADFLDEYTRTGTYDFNGRKQDGNKKPRVPLNEPR